VDDTVGEKIPEGTTGVPDLMSVAANGTLRLQSVDGSERPFARYAGNCISGVLGKQDRSL
jgi:hypothetical protein